MERQSVIHFTYIFNFYTERLYKKVESTLPMCVPKNIIKANKMKIVINFVNGKEVLFILKYSVGSCIVNSNNVFCKMYLKVTFKIRLHFQRQVL